MSNEVKVAIIAAVASLLLAIVNAVIAALKSRSEKKSGMEQRIESIEKKLDKLTEHNDLQYLSLLRLTVMDTDMPMGERLVAGKEYLSRGGNGEVRKFYEDLEKGLKSRE